jgi:hypothetical protein
MRPTIFRGRSPRQGSPIWPIRRQQNRTLASIAVAAPSLTRDPGLARDPRTAQPERSVRVLISESVYAGVPAGEAVPFLLTTARLFEGFPGKRQGQIGLKAHTRRRRGATSQNSPIPDKSLPGT